MLPRIALVLLIALSVAASGCAHVSLGPAPSRAAAPDQRVAAYRTLRPSAHATDIGIYVSETTAAVWTTDSLVLADGTTIEHADDLLPVLDPSTPSARAARRSGRARSNKAWWSVGSVVAAVGGVAMVILAAPPSSCDTFTDPCERNDSLSNAGLATMLVAGLVGGFTYYYFGHQEQKHRRAAFATYDESLRESLGVCVDGLQVVACDPHPTAATAPASW